MDVQIELSFKRRTSAQLLISTEPNNLTPAMHSTKNNRW